jgi:hypothetical protein
MKELVVATKEYAAKPNDPVAQVREPTTHFFGGGGKGA